MIVERASAADGGYAIGLYPLGSCVLHGLGLYDQLVANSHEVERYELTSRTGQVLQAIDMSILTAAVGPMLMISRAALVEILESGCSGADLRRGVTVQSLVDDGKRVAVTFSDGSSDHFDVVVACDGIGSATRELVFGPAKGFDSGWVLWTWWADPGHFAPEVAREWWGAGCFFGVYPTPGQLMCAAGGPHDAVDPEHVRPSLRRLAATLADEDAIGGLIDDFEDAYAWPMRDVRSDRWVEGRVALCGDAATGFLPTAGVGASNAMRATAALADELSRADNTMVPLALELYEKRCRSVIERNQTDSRRLGRLMFVRRGALAWVRDQVASRYPADKALAQIIDSVHQPF